DLPSFRADPQRHGCRSETVIAVNLEKKIILIAGTAYAGEMKKGVFGLLNFILPAQGIMPMHCSANIGPKGDTAIFFGLSGTGTALDNVVIHPVTRELDFDDATLAENSRGAYPIDFIPNSSRDNMGPPPKNVVMLTADAFGVLPPIARLTPDQAMYHFLSGYTA